VQNEHYFTADPVAAHDFRRVTYEVNGKILQLDTDAGTFARKGVDYGSRVLVETILQEHLPQTGRLLDLGCGYGPIGLALAASLPQWEVVLTDINKRAAGLARQNARNNRLNVTVLEGEGCGHVSGLFDIIALNPPIRAGKEVIYGLFDQCAAKLQPHGSLYVVMRKDQGAASAQKKLEEILSHCQRIARDSGFWILCAQKGDEV